MKETKFIVGKLDSSSKKATMSLFSDIDTWSANDFIYEMKWLEDCGYEEIDILINSVGGSVIDGISIYSHIINSKVKCTTIIEGVAMSMGSIVWAAGDKLKMKDYGILMIHNPFSTSGVDPEKNKDLAVTLDSFRNQMKTIYTKRFGLSEEAIDKIMDGEEGVDGTYFNPEQAVEAGFIKESDIIKTEAIEKETVLNALGDFKGSKFQYAHILAKSVGNVVTENSKENSGQPKNKDNTIIGKISKKIGEVEGATQKTTKSKNMENLSFIVAALKLPKDSDVNAVVASLTEMKETNTKLSKENGALVEAKTKLETEIAGHKTSIANMKETLAKTEDELGKYQAKEQAEKEQAIEALVDNAIEQGKISEDAKDSWIKMASADLELTKTTLDSIEAKKTVTEQILEDEEGVKKAVEGKSTKEKLISNSIEETEEFKAKMALLDD